jgi:hypothetical protein
MSNRVRLAIAAFIITVVILYPMQDVSASHSTCNIINPTHWDKPAQQVFKHHHIEFARVSLCEDNTYAIFYGRAPYALDVEANHAKLVEFLQALLDSNHQVAFTYVDLNSRSLAYVKEDPESGTVSIDMNHY